MIISAVLHLSYKCGKPVVFKQNGMSPDFKNGIIVQMFLISQVWTLDKYLS